MLSDREFDFITGVDGNDFWDNSIRIGMGIPKIIDVLLGTSVWENQWSPK